MSTSTESISGKAAVRRRAFVTYLLVAAGAFVLVFGI